MKSISNALYLFVAAIFFCANARAAATFSAADIVAWWRADGSAQDAVGGNHSTLKGAASYGPGMVGQAFANLNGQNEWVLGPEAGALKRSGIPWTVENWVRVDQLQSEWIPLTAIKPGFFGLFYNKNGKYLRAHSAKNRYNPDGYYLDVSWELPMGEWLHVAQVFNPATDQIAIYANGQLLTSAPGTMFYWGWANSDGPLQIGKGWQPHEYWMNFVASYDELTVFSRALSQQEIESIYLAGAEGKVATPVLTETKLPDALPGIGYDAVVRTLGGRAPFAFTLVNGALPSGLSLSADGRVSGVASAPADVTVRVRTTDADGLSAEGDVRVRVDGCGLPAGVADGTWDPSFPRLTEPVVHGRGGSGSIARQSNGKLIHTTWHHPNYPLPAGVFLKRYTAQGALDASFGGGGSIFIPFGSGLEVRSVLVMPDDRLLVLSRDTWNGQMRFSLSRYSADGVFDTTFGVNGVAKGSLTDYDEPRALALQGDGKIIAIGTSLRFTQFQDYNFMMMRFNADGSVDTSFGDNGYVETQTGTSEGVASVAIQPDGKILVLGSAGAAHIYGDIGFLFQVARYNPDGSLDPTFSGDGIAHVRFVRYDFPTTILLQPDGKILVSGWADNSFNYNWIAIARLFPNGELDECFGDRGKVLAQYFDKDRRNHSSTLSAAIALQNDGRIVAAGVTTLGFENHVESFLARFNSNGSADKSFGEEGWAFGGWLSLGRMMWTGASFLIEPAGDFVVAHTMALGGLETPTLARFQGTGLCEWTENTAPIAVDDAATTGQTPVDIAVLANDSDPEGDLPRITRTIVDARARGTVAIVGDKIRYTPDAGFGGEAVFKYEITDCPGLTAIATVRVRVTLPQMPPVAHSGEAQTLEDTAVVIALSAEDPNGDALMAQIETGTAHGELSLNADGTLTYMPDANFNGVDSFTFSASDGVARSGIAEVIITVLPVNDAPVASGDSATTDEEASVNIAVLENDSDVDGDVLSVAAVSSAAHGTVTINADGTISYTPEANYHGADSFSYTVSDGQGGAAEAMVTVAVRPVNDAPAAAGDDATTNEDTAVTVAALANDTDIDGDILTVSEITQPANGSAVLNEDGTITYTPNANFHGSDSLSYSVADGQGGVATATLAITVLPADDAPIAGADNAVTLEETAITIVVLANDSDVDSGLVVTAVSQPAHGSVVLNADGTVTYTPEPNFNGTDSFNYTLEGAGESQVVVTVLPVNDAPAAANDAATTAQGSAVSIAVLANDSDIEGDALSVSAVGQPANGAVAINADGTITYTPNSSFAGSDSFAYTLSDGQGGFATATVNVTVTPVQPPVSYSRGKVTGGGTITVGAGKANFGFEALVTGNGRIQGNVTFHDRAANRDFKSAEVISVRVSDDRKHAVVEGRGTINGAVFVNFVMEVSDFGEPGGGVDRFAIRFSDGYRAGGTVIRPGNIQIHK